MGEEARELVVVGLGLKGEYRHVSTCTKGGELSLDALQHTWGEAEVIHCHVDDHHLIVVLVSKLVKGRVVLGPLGDFVLGVELKGHLKPRRSRRVPQRQWQ